MKTTTLLTVLLAAASVSAFPQNRVLLRRADAAICPTNAPQECTVTSTTYFCCAADEVCNTKEQSCDKKTTAKTTAAAAAAKTTTQAASKTTAAADDNKAKESAAAAAAKTKEEKEEAAEKAAKEKAEKEAAEKKAAADKAAAEAEKAKQDAEKNKDLTDAQKAAAEKEAKDKADAAAAAAAVAAAAVPTVSTRTSTRRSTPTATSSTTSASSPTSTSSESKSSSPGFATATNIGALSGSLVGLIIIVSGITFCCMRTRRRGRLLAEAYADPTRKPYDPIVLPGEKSKENLSQPSSRVGSQLPERPTLVRKTTSIDEMSSFQPVGTAGPLDSYNSHSRLVGAGGASGHDSYRQSRQTSAAYSNVKTMSTPTNRFSFEPQVEQPPPAMVYDRSRDSGSSNGGYASPYGPPSPYGPRSYTPVHTPPPQPQMAPGGSWGTFPAPASPPSRVLPQGMGDGRPVEAVKMQQLPPQTMGYAM